MSDTLWFNSKEEAIDKNENHQVVIKLNNNNMYSTFLDMNSFYVFYKKNGGPFCRVFIRNDPCMGLC